MARLERVWLVPCVHNSCTEDPAGPPGQQTGGCAPAAHCVSRSYERATAQTTRVRARSGRIVTRHGAIRLGVTAARQPLELLGLGSNPGGGARGCSGNPSALTVETPTVPGIPKRRKQRDQLSPARSRFLSRARGHQITESSRRDCYWGRPAPRDGEDPITPLASDGLSFDSKGRADPLRRLHVTRLRALAGLDAESDGDDKLTIEMDQAISVSGTRSSWQRRSGAPRRPHPLTAPPPPLPRPPPK